MVNQYCNLVGTDLIKNSYTQINTGFDNVQADVNNLPVSSLYRNAIINGNFEIWQRGTSFVNPGGLGTYTADRWGITHSAGVGFEITVSREAFTPGQTDVPNEPKYFLRATVSNAAGANRIGFFQDIEDVRSFAGKTITVSYWVKLNNSRLMRPYVITQVFGSGGSASVTHAPGAETVPAGVWTKRSFSLTLSSVAGKTIGDNSFLALEIRVESPQNGDVIDIAQVQVCAGEVDLPYQPRHYLEEQLLCARYNRRFNQAIAFQLFGHGYAQSATEAYIFIPMSPRARVIPTLTRSGNIRLGIAGSTATVTNIAVFTALSTLDLICLQVTVASGLTAGQGALLQADNDSSAYINLDMEL